MIVKIQKEIEFIITCDLICDFDQLAKAIIWFAKGKPTSRLKKIFIYGQYPAVSIYEQKIHVHRLLMMYWLGRELDSGEYVHHKNKNRFDATDINLEVQGVRYHQSLINKGKKQTLRHILKRINATTKTRYGHSIYENPELMEKK